MTCAMKQNENLNRDVIQKLLWAGLIGAILTGAGDFLLGYAPETADTTIAAGTLTGAPCLSDFQLIAGGLLGVIGIFLEGIASFAIYRLMADKAPGYAKIYKIGIFGYIWLAPIGAHMNMGMLNMAYKYLLSADPAIAGHTANLMFRGFGQPLYFLLGVFWLPMIVIQFIVFARGLTPYPKSAKWFTLLIGAIPPLIISYFLGTDNPLGPAIGTMFLSFGNAWIFGGLLCTLPSSAAFEQFLVPSTGE